MQSNLQKLKNSQIKATVELNQEDLQKYADKAETMLGGDLEIKGFRKGKAPKDLVRKHLEPGAVRALALEIAVEGSLSEVIRKNELNVIDTSQLSIEKNDSVQLRYSVMLDLFPEVELVDLTKVKVKKREVKVEDKEVEDALEVIKNSRSVFEQKGDNEAAESGDRVEVDFEVRKDGQVIDGGVSKNHPIILGGRNFIPGFEEQLVGMRKGESKSFTLVAPDDYFYKDIAGKKLDFSVKLNDIKKIIKPEINDQFAKSLGHFASLTELKENVRDGLTQEKSLKENQKLRLEILDAIIGQSKIDISENLLNKQLDIMVSDFDHTLHEKGLELSLYLAKIGKTQDELKKDWVKDAERQVKISLVLKKLAKDRSLEATEEEIEEMASQAIQSAMARGESPQGNVDLARIKEEAAVRITNEKALSYLESQCAA